jgi:ABC-2 type transport system ATP-binding protein
MIEVKNLVRYYGANPAVRDVSFSVKEGEILGFLGPNAAGKTTTMRILTGIMPASSGTATIAGFDVQEQSIEVRKRLGYLPENCPLYTDMTVKGYLNFHAKIKGVLGKERKGRVEEVLKKCFIDDVKNKLIGKLSKGYRQRVGLAQALVHDPQVLILDEPTVGLDPVAIKETRDLIKSLGGKHTIILSTHILPEVSMTCGRVVIIHKGKVVAEDTPENLTAQLKGAFSIYLELKKSSDDIEQQLLKIPGVLKVEKEKPNAFRVESGKEKDIREDIASFAVNKGYGLLELRTERMTLEDVFVELTAKEGGE